MATKGNTPAAPPKPVTCAVCGKTLTRTASVTAGQGSTCQHVQAQFSTPAALQAHYAQYTGNVPAGYITLASLGNIVRAAQQTGKYAGLNVNKLVTAIGRDRVKNAPLHPICTPVYNGRQRYVNPWLATPAGLQAIATLNFSAAPKA